MDNQPIQPDWKQLKELLKECTDSIAEINLNDNATLQTDSNPKIPEANKEKVEGTSAMDEEKRKLEEIIEAQKRIILLQKRQIQELEEKIRQIQTSKSLCVDDTSLNATKNETTMPSIFEVQQRIQELRAQISLLKGKSNQEK